MSDVLEASGTPYGDLTVVDRDNRISISSQHPTSEQVDSITAGVSHLPNESEFRIRANSSVESVQTVQSLSYSPGYIGEIGIAIRVPVAPTGDQEVRWGYWDGNDGVYFGYDSDGVFMERQRNGSRLGKVYEEDWVGDAGPIDSETLLNEGTISRIVLGLYNYGFITGELFETTEDDKIGGVDTHSFRPRDETTLSSQNLPLRVEVDNASDASDFDVFLSDRQATLRGQFTANDRVKGTRGAGISLSGTTWVPIVSFKKKAPRKETSIELFRLTQLTDSDVFIQFRVGADSADDTNYTAPENVDAAETAIEINDSPNAGINDGFWRFQTIFEGGSGAATSVGDISGVDLNIRDERPMTMFVRRVSGTGGSINAFTLNWRESW